MDEFYAFDGLPTLGSFERRRASTFLSASEPVSRVLRVRQVIYILGWIPMQLSFHPADYLRAHAYGLDISELGSIGLLRGLYRWVNGPVSPGSLASATILQHSDVCHEPSIDVWIRRGTSEMTCTVHRYLGILPDQSNEEYRPAIPLGWMLSDI